MKNKTFKYNLSSNYPIDYIIIFLINFGFQFRRNCHKASIFDLFASKVK